MMTTRVLSILFLGAGLAAHATPISAQSPSSPASAPAAPPASDAPQVGDVIPAFDAPNLDDTTRHIAFPKGSHTIVLFFLSGCPTCHKMIPEWNKAFEHRPKGLDVVAVMLDHEPPGFFMSMPISFPVVRTPAPDFGRKLKITHVPVTMRVGPGGKVEDVGVGFLDPIRLGEIFRP
jgi:hypothetical protein